MIYDFQTLKPGSTLWGDIGFRGLLPMDVLALRTALAHASLGAQGDGFLFRLGAKSSVGFGLVSLRMAGAVRVDAPSYEPTDALMPTTEDDPLRRYQAHLRDNKAEIIDALNGAV